LNAPFNKKLIIAALKSCAHIAVYILLGLLLAIFINNAVRAA
jgi:VanZ family protein